MKRLRALTLLGAVVISMAFVSQTAYAWQREFNGTENALDNALDVAVDHDDAIFATGYIQNTVTSYDILVVKLAGADGHTVWRKEINGGASGPDSAATIVLDGNGDAIVGGGVFNIGTTQDIAVFKLSGVDGSPVWEAMLTGTDLSVGDTVSRVTLDPSGDVIAVGRVGNVGRGEDIAIVKLSGTDGSVTWRTELNGTASSRDSVSAVGVDADGDVLVAGTTRNVATGDDVSVIKLSGSDGAVLWRRDFSGPDALSPEGAMSVVVGASGDVFVSGVLETGGVVLRLRGSDGNLVWQTPGPGIQGMIALDSAGDLLLAAGNFAVAKLLGSSGATVWQREFTGTGGGGGGAGEVTVDSAGNPVVVGYVVNAATDRDIVITKLSAASGSPLWWVDLTEAVAEQDGGEGIALDSEGNVAAVGWSWNAGKSGDATIIKRLGTDGSDFAPNPCEDENLCTTDTEDPVLGCVHTPVPGRPCDDGEVCTEGEVCDALGSCAGGTAPDCDDGNACTVDGCMLRARCTHIDTCGTLDSAIVGVGYICVNQSGPGGPLSGIIQFDPISCDVMGSMVDLSTVGPVSFTGDLGIDWRFNIAATPTNPQDLTFEILGGDAALCILGACFIGDLSNTASSAFPALTTVALTLDGHLFGGFSDVCGVAPATLSGAVALNALRRIATAAGTEVALSVDNVYFDSRWGTSSRGSVTVTFAEVLAAGETVARLRSNGAGATSAMLSIPGVVPFIDVSTTATVQGAIVICTNYSDADDDGVADGTIIREESLRFVHEENGVFVNRTTSLDPVTNTICGETLSLSAFTVGMAPPGCGDGVLGDSEECDDGNGRSGDGCSWACKTEVGLLCGNGLVDAGEQCDDGNTTSGDCCSSTCQAEDLGTVTCGVGACQRTVQRCLDGIPETCAGGTPGTEGPAGSPSCSNSIDDDCDGAIDATDTGCQAVCGNGFVDAGEQCDPPGGQDGCAMGEVCSADCAACVRLTTPTPVTATAPATNTPTTTPTTEIREPVTGGKLVVRDDVDTQWRKIVFLSHASVSIGAPGSSGDPRCTAPGGGGGSLRLSSTTSGQDTAPIALPCANWALIGSETDPKGYEYWDPEQDQGPCKRVILKAGRRIKAVCGGKNTASSLPYDLTEGVVQDPVAVTLTTGSALTYCAEFGGNVVKRGDDGKLFKAKGAPAPATCPGAQ